MTSHAQSRVAGSSRPVVEAFVRSVDRDPGQPEADEVGHQQHGPGVPPGGARAIRGQLVERVERQELEAVPGIQAGRSRTRWTASTPAAVRSSR